MGTASLASPSLACTQPHTSLSKHQVPDGQCKAVHDGIWPLRLGAAPAPRLRSSSLVVAAAPDSGWYTDAADHRRGVQPAGNDSRGLGPRGIGGLSEPAGLFVALPVMETGGATTTVDAEPMAGYFRGRKVMPTGVWTETAREQDLRWRLQRDEALEQLGGLEGMGESRDSENGAASASTGTAGRQEVVVHGEDEAVEVTGTAVGEEEKEEAAEEEGAGTSVHQIAQLRGELLEKNAEAAMLQVALGVEQEMVSLMTSMAVEVLGHDTAKAMVADVSRGVCEVEVGEESTSLGVGPRQGWLEKLGVDGVASWKFGEGSELEAVLLQEQLVGKQEQVDELKKSIASRHTLVEKIAKAMGSQSAARKVEDVVAQGGAWITAHFYNRKRAGVGKWNHQEVMDGEVEARTRHIHGHKIGTKGLAGWHEDLVRFGHPSVGGYYQRRKGMGKWLVAPPGEDLEAEGQKVDEERERGPERRDEDIEDIVAAALGGRAAHRGDVGPANRWRKLPHIEVKGVPIHLGDSNKTVNELLEDHWNFVVRKRSTQEARKMFPLHISAAIWDNKDGYVVFEKDIVHVSDLEHILDEVAFLQWLVSFPSGAVDDLDSLEGMHQLAGGSDGNWQLRVFRWKTLHGIICAETVSEDCRKRAKELGLGLMIHNEGHREEYKIDL